MFYGASFSSFTGHQTHQTHYCVYNLCDHRCLMCRHPIPIQGDPCTCGFHHCLEGSGALRQLSDIILITSNHALLHLWGKQNLVKHQKASRYYDCGCAFITGHKGCKGGKHVELELIASKIPDFFQSLKMIFLPSGHDM